MERGEVMVHSQALKSLENVATLGAHVHALIQVALRALKWLCGKNAEPGERVRVHGMECLQQ